MAAVLNRPAAARRPGRTLRLAGLAALVGGLHLGALDRFLVDRLGEGAGERGMRRIEVAFVKELAPAEPPAVVAAPAPAPAAPAARQAVRPAPKASDPVPAPEAPPPEPVLPAEPPRPPPPEPAPVVAAAEAPPAPEPAASAAEVAVAASAPAAAASVAATAIASGAVAFEWPPSTRLSYELRGNYRGEVQGSASVEWIRVQQRYQVHMEALVGPPFAPLLARRISSEGELTDNGLVPRRFEGEQRVAFSKRRWSMRFDDERIVLPDGRELPPAAGVQDEASQFVQLAWQFTMRPELLVPGRSVAFPLALPRRVEGWTYDAVEEELLRLPFGEVPTVHLKPRRQATKAGDLAVEMWIAPTLQNLPVRILIHQDAQTFIDLSLKSPPLQAAK